ncbi:carboxypeptidase regulatory-like domain-containing protein [Lutibacter sp.]|uniref:carboxypeptidase regulatory-like domain-containing protein n=1 Tax=Lutibacter sp. TaxID=1925666 RepID=UPI0035689793
MRLFKLFLACSLFITLSTDTYEVKSLSLNKYSSINLTDCTQTISGVILDKETKKPIANSIVSLLLNEEEITITKTNNLGEYTFKLKCNLDYKISVKATGYFNKIHKFKTDTVEKKFTQNIELNKQCYQTISGVFKNDISKEIIHNVTITLNKNGEEIEKLKVTDGNYSFNVECNENYSIITSTLNYINDFYEFSTSNKSNDNIKHDFNLEPECVQTITGTIKNKITKEPIGATLKLFINNIETQTIKVNNDGKYTVQFQCATNYKIVASRTDYIDDTYNFLTDYIEDKQPDYFHVKKDLLLEPDECFQIVSGTVLDKVTNKIIPKSLVTLIYQNQEIKSFQTNEDASYFFNVKCGLSYEIKAEKADMTSNTTNYIASSVKNEKVVKNVYLEHKLCKQVLNGLIVDKITKLPITNTSVSIVENNNEIGKKTTDEKGQFSFDISCDKTYKIVASNSNYTTESTEFKTSTTRDFKNSKTLELQPLECNQIVSGIIRDKITKKPLPNTTINLYQDNKVINSFTVGEDGIYEFPLHCETSYKLTVFKNNNLDAFRLKTAIENGRQLTLNIDIEPLVCVQFINGIVKESISENAIPNAKITLFNHDKEIAKTDTDSNGSFYFEIECSKAYTIVAQKDNYTKVSTQLFSTDKTAVPNNVILTLEPIVLFTEKNGIKYIETKPLNFVLDEFELNNEVKLELNKIIYNMNQNPSIKIEVNYHTDSRGPDDYNLQLTKNRANSTKEYLISKGISADRIKANGYGETMLLNKCSNNIKCTEEEHSKNRRAEFKVLNK